MVWSSDSSIQEIGAGLSEGDILQSLGGNNTPNRLEINDAMIAGESGNDLVLGGSQDDLLIGYVGDDSIYGSVGNDTLLGGTGHLIVEDWEGQDLLVGGSGDDLIFGNQGDDTLYASEGDDTLYGGKDRDNLYGNVGNNVLSGDLGSDTLFGGGGENRFQIGRRFDAPGFQSTGGATLADADWIMDFSPGKDLIELLGGLTFDDLNILAGTGENTGDTILQDKATQEYLAIVKNISPEAIARSYFLPPSQQPPLSPFPTQNPQEDTTEAVDQIPSSDSVTPTDEQVITPTDEPVITPDESVVSPTDEEVVTPTDEQVVTPDEQVVNPTDEQVVNPSDEQVVTPTDEPVITPIDESVITPDEQIVNPSDEQVITPDEQVVNPSDEQVITPDEQIVNPTDEPVVTPTDEPVITPTDEPVITPTDEPVITPTDEPVITPTDEPVITPTDEPVITPTDEPVITPTDENETEEPEEPADTEPDTSSEIEEPADLEPGTSAETEETEEPADTEPDTFSEIEEPADLEPDTSSEIEEPEEPADTEPTPEENEIPPIEAEDGGDTSGEIEEEPLDEDGDDSTGEETEISAPANYADAASGIIADLSKGIVTRLFTTSADVSFKILPLGDSNTRGFPNQASIGGYRTRLWERLVGENGFNIDFVGQASSGPGNIDINHEGRGGFTINELIDNSAEFPGYNQSGTPPYTTIENALKEQPNAILLMAGTNDILQGDSAQTAITDLGVLVDRITKTLPEAQVLVASIIPHTSFDQDRQQRTKEFSEQVYEFVVAPRANTNPNIRFVDMFKTPLVSTSDYSSDGIHLNPSGYDKLADEWYSEIRMLPSGEETLTDVQHIIGSAYDDTLIGNDGANEIQGGGGNDWLIGGAGEDTFILAPGEGRDTIADFENGIDRLGLSDGLQFEQLIISTGSDASETHIAIANSEESLATLMGIDASTISADDFILV